VSPPVAADDRLQDGLYFRSGETPLPAFGLLLLDIRNGTRVDEARGALAQLWAMLGELRRGTVRDFRGEDGEPAVAFDAGGLSVLLGYGARLWQNHEKHSPRLAGDDVRPRLPQLLQGPNRPFRALHWAPPEQQRRGEADLALQLIGERGITVDRAVVETWKLIHDEQLPLEIVAFHRGFQRDDRRSWIDFHDGINNMSSSERATAIVLRVPDPPWLEGGTFMAFLRIRVDLAAWRKLPRAHQEISVGRDKISGWPLREVQTGDGGALVPVPAGTVVPGDDTPREQLAAYRNPGHQSQLLAMSHIHRSNRNRGGPEQDANNRIYRQGYEFLEVTPDGRMELGLNFVSFQRSTQRVTDILKDPGWQGDSNFGGPPPGQGEPQVVLMELVAGGFYAVPPKGDPFPGAALF